MKYTRLTKEQFEELHLDFARFLAAQSIDVNEWSSIKEKTPHLAEEILDVFSDVVWEGVLDKVDYIETWSNNHVYLFFFGTASADLIAIKGLNPEIDFNTAEGFKWLKENFEKDEVELYKASKPYSADKNHDKFECIKHGGVITKGEFFNNLKKLVD